MGKKIILLFLFGILLFPLVNAAPKVPVIAEAGVDINFPMIDVFEQGENFSFHFHTTNASNGAFLDDSVLTCSFHVYNDTGNHIVEKNYDVGMESNNIDWDILVVGENFTNVGEYGYLFDCNSTIQGIGGSVESGFEVTNTGVALTEERAIIFIGLLGLLAFLFVVNMGGFAMLPSSDTRDDEGAIIDINNLKYIRPVLLVVGWALLMAMFFIGSNIGFAYLGSTLVANILFDIYKIMMLLTLPLVVVWFLWIFVSIFKDKEMKNLIERGGGLQQI